MTATSASTTCGGSVGFTATSVTLKGGSIGPAPAGSGAASCMITVTVTAASTTTNAVPAGTIGGVNYAAAAGTLTVSTVTGEKSFSPATALQGGTTALTITLRNNSGVATTITSVTDNLATMGAGQFVGAGGRHGRRHVRSRSLRRCRLRC